MIRINLLPHRELRRAALQRRFYILAATTLAIGGAVVISVHGIIAGRIDKQTARNSYLEKEIALLDKQIEEIRKLKDQTQALLARKKVVETLQENRTETVHLLDQIVRLLPDGIYLKQIKETGNRVNIVGYAQSNARVSTLMRNLESSPWLSAPSLVEIKAVTLNKAALNEFSLNVDLSHPKPTATADAKPVEVKKG